MGLETIRCRIEEGFSRLASTRVFVALRRAGRHAVRHISTSRFFPATRRAEFEAILKESDDSTKRRKLEAWLDRGHGECWLSRAAIAELVEEVLLAADGRDYRMQAWIIMPNHVHLVVDVWDVPLVKLINGWNGKSSREANKLLGRNGAFWQEDYYDTLVRDEAHLKRAVRYTEQNPVNAFLAKAARDWLWSSARHRDEYEHRSAMNKRVWSATFRSLHRANGR